MTTEKRKEATKRTLVAGTPPKGRRTRVDLSEVIGKTVAAVESGTSEGAFGEEPTTWLVFEDRSEHGFVHPADEG